MVAGSLPLIHDRWWWKHTYKRRTEQLQILHFVRRLLNFFAHIYCCHISSILISRAYLWKLIPGIALKDFGISFFCRFYIWCASVVLDYAMMLACIGISICQSIRCVLAFSNRFVIHFVEERALKNWSLSNQSFFYCVSISLACWNSEITIAFLLFNTKLANKTRSQSVDCHLSELEKPSSLQFAIVAKRLIAMTFSREKRRANEFWTNVLTADRPRTQSQWRRSSL